MPGFLKQSTASQSRTLGPFIDDTDFKTPETALTINNTDVKLMINGAASVNKNSGGGTHRQSGHYAFTFDATDTATVGELTVSIVVAGALPVFDKFFVVEEAVYDALFAASAAGYQVPIWASAGSTVNLSGTTVKTLTDAPSDSSGTTTLLSRVSSARAGYLDNLSAGAVALQATLTTVEGKIDTIDTVVDAILDDTGTTGVEIAANALDAAALATDAVDEIKAAIAAITITELASIPAASPSLIQAIALVYMAIRNKRDTDSTGGTDEIHNDAGTVIGTATVSDSGTLFSKGKYA